MPGRNRLKKRSTVYKNFVTDLNEKGSKSYRSVIEKMGVLNACINESSALSAEEFDEKKKKDLAKAYKESIQAVEALRIKLGSSFEVDEEMVGVLLYIRKYLSKDYATLNKNLANNESLSLNDILENSRSKTIKLDKELDKYEGHSGNQNTRYKLSLKLDNGNETDGYFTKDKTELEVNQENGFIVNALMDISDKYSLEYADLEKGYFYQTAIRLASHPDIVDLIDTKEGLNDSIVNGCNVTMKEIAAICKKDKDNDAINLLKHFRDPMTFRALLEFMHDISGPMIEKINRNVLGINPTARTNRRNSAMSMVAELIGCDDVIAHSENVKVEYVEKSDDPEIPDEKHVIKGTFMEAAKGYDIMHIDENNVMYKADYSFIEDSKGLNKKIAKLQILDYLCGNPDRHAANMLYIIKDGKLVSIQGIDNDTCFGANDHTKQMAGVSPEKLMVIPEDTAARIMALDEESFKFMLYSYNITNLEADNAVSRLKTLKSMIKESEKVYENSVEGNLIPGKLKVCDDKELDYLSLHSQLSQDIRGREKNDLAEGNLFGMVERRFRKKKGTGMVLKNHKKVLFEKLSNLCTADAAAFSDALAPLSENTAKVDTYKNMFHAAKNASMLLSGNINLIKSVKEDDIMTGLAYTDKYLEAKENIEKGLEYANEFMGKYSSQLNKYPHIKESLDDLKKSLVKIKTNMEDIDRELKSFNAVIKESDEIDKTVTAVNKKIVMDFESGKKQKIRLNQLRNDLNTCLEPVEEEIAFSKYEIDNINKEIKKEKNPKRLRTLEQSLENKQTEYNLNRLNRDAAYGLVSILTDPEGYKNNDAFKRGLAAGLIRYKIDFMNKSGGKAAETDKIVKMNDILTDIKDYDACIEHLLRNDNFNKMANALSPAAFSPEDVKKISEGKIKECFEKVAGSYLAPLPNLIKQSL
ncbi:MAG: hypothetical protein IKR27_03660 [Lachnospiraceae bacterium]|nr:hypothetical protein [Lachnospiraceae bacterium]